jgi:methionyl aminopeptidase
MIYLKTPEEIERIKEVNLIGAELLNLCYNYIEPGVKTLEIEELALNFCSGIRSLYLSFFGYKGFPHYICVSLNDEVIHGFPDEKIVQQGDIVSVDIGLSYKGYYSDAAFTKIVGKSTRRKKKLVKITKECLYEGIKKAVPENHISDISNAIQSTATRAGFNVVRNYVGHGVGFEVHEEPKIFNYVSDSIDWKLRSGMVIAIEPILVDGEDDVSVGSNGWTVITKNGGMAAHFEHSVAITDDGPVVLSKL